MALIPSEKFLKAKKVLYMTHLALGDFLYQKIFLEGLKRTYPHLQIDIWIESGRIRNHGWREGRNKALTEWIENESFIHRFYPAASSEIQLKQMVEDAKAEKYDIVFFIGILRTDRYALMARKIAKSAFIVGTKADPLQRFLRKTYAFLRLNAWYNIEEYKVNPEDHVIDEYAYHFDRIAGLSLAPEEKKPSLNIPSDSLRLASEWYENTLKNFKLDKKVRKVFINHLSTSDKRDWPIDKVFNLIDKIRGKIGEALFVINAPPDQYVSLANAIEGLKVKNKASIVPFTAHDNFFELPAVIANSDVSISVETSVMHFANVLNVPLVALMRSNVPHWRPLDNGRTTVLFAKGKHGWVENISLEKVFDAFEQVSNLGNDRRVNQYLQPGHDRPGEPETAAMVDA